MVRNKTTIFAEVNNEDTVLQDTINIDNGFITGNGDKSIAPNMNSNEFGYIIYMIDGVVQLLPIEPNKRLGLNSAGNLTWL